MADESVRYISRKHFRREILFSKVKLKQIKKKKKKKKKTKKKESGHIKLLPTAVVEGGMVA